jgi:hypothetical protein
MVDAELLRDERIADPDVVGMTVKCCDRFPGDAQLQADESYSAPNQKCK